MIEKIGRPAMLEQLAEEASELAQACLKLAQCARELKLKPDEEQIDEKHSGS